MFLSFYMRAHPSLLLTQPIHSSCPSHLSLWALHPLASTSLPFIPRDTPHHNLSTSYASPHLAPPLPSPLLLLAVHATIFRAMLGTPGTSSMLWW